MDTLIETQDERGEFSGLLEELRAAGMSDSEVARTLTERGVKVTQPAISRIRTGNIRNPRYALGDALKLLYAQRMQRPYQSSPALANN